MNLIEPIHEHAKAQPETPAIITPTVKVSWSELDKLIWSTALTFATSGLEAGDRVGITMLHPLVHLVSSLALARMGVAHIAIPLSVSDASRIELTKTLNLKCLIVDSEKVVATNPNAFLLKKLAVLNVTSEQKQKIGAINGDLPWMILQSSGTTGSPKFAELSHYDAIQRYEHSLEVIHVVPGDIVWVPSRLDFFNSKYTSMRALRGGASSCLPIGMSTPTQLVDFLNFNKVSYAVGIPSLMAQLAEIGKPIPSLRFFGVTSAPVYEKTKKEFKSKVNPNLFVIYATNEAGTITVNSPKDPMYTEGSVGRPAPNATVEIVDSNGVTQPKGQTGEIRVRVPGMVRSYLNSPDLTAMYFRNDWFYPGDVGLINDENELVFLGRKDDMMVFDGVNIYPAEIENVLSSHPDVFECAAFPLKHQRFHHVPVCAVKLRKLVSEEELTRYCKEKIGFKHPRKIFVIEEFPRNAMGKILKRELPQLIINSTKSE